jgi:hypothetical protein
MTILQNCPPAQQPRRRRNLVGRARLSRVALSAAMLPLLALPLCIQPAVAQTAPCAPSSADEPGSGGSSPSSAAARLRHRDPLVREMARADQLYDNGQRDAAEDIYRRLAQTRPDRHQTARRAKLKLAQAALSRRDLATALGLAREANDRRALPELRKRAQRLLQRIEYAQGVEASEVALDDVNALISANRLDEAIVAAERLSSRPCPYSADFPSRVQLRLAQSHRAKGDFASARKAAAAGLALATTAKARERASAVIGEIEAAAYAGQLRQTVDQAMALIDAGNAQGAVTVLEPMLAAQTPPPPDVEASIRLRLARAYGRLRQYDRASEVLRPLLSPGGDARIREQATRAAAGIDAAEYETVARAIVARGAALQAQGDFAAAARSYEEVLAWHPPPPPQVRDAARLGLARARARLGSRSAAIEQIELVKASNTNLRLIERANDLLADIENDAPLDRLTGFVQFGIAYDSNAPTVVSALRAQDDDVPFPRDRRFDDGQANLSARLQYRTAIGDRAYWEVSAAGRRTVQFDLSSLDRTLIGLRTGPAFALGNGNVQLQFGGRFDAEWRSGAFRSSEPGGYVGLRWTLADSLSASASYTLAWHNDYRNEFDGLYHSLELKVRRTVGHADVVTFRARAEREGADDPEASNWAFLGGAAWRHRWKSDGAVSPFLEFGAEGERLVFDRPAPLENRRRDWKVNLEARAGVDLDDTWQIGLGYAFLDISSNEHARDRLANHRLELTVRYTWD